MNNASFFDLEENRFDLSSLDRARFDEVLQDFEFLRVVPESYPVRSFERDPLLRSVHIY